MLDMLYVEPGTFTMGSPTSETGRGTDETEHNVSLTKGFYLGKYEVTQAQYEAVMTGNTDGLSATPSNWPNNPNRPVETVSWNDVQVFLSELNSKLLSQIPTGYQFTLPTESQWEFACRAGTTSAYEVGSSITTSDANILFSINETSDVGTYPPNSWGFYDMHGNVWEWTADAYATYPTGNPVVDPTSPGTSSSNRVERGGSWQDSPSAVRSAKRIGIPPSAATSVNGFRVALTEI